MNNSDAERISEIIRRLPDEELKNSRWIITGESTVVSSNDDMEDQIEDHVENISDLPASPITEDQTESKEIQVSPDLSRFTPFRIRRPILRRNRIPQAGRPIIPSITIPSIIRQLFPPTENNISLGNSILGNPPPIDATSLSYLSSIYNSINNEESNWPNNTSEFGIPCPDTEVIKADLAKPIVAECVACKTNQIQTVNFPCMHACYCLECAKPSLRTMNTCPVCRCVYMHISVLYLSYREVNETDGIDFSSNKKRNINDISPNH
jgi:hypothetical protein